MAKKGFTPEQIIDRLREAELLLNQGSTIAVVSKKIGVSDRTYYRWRKEYGGMRVDQARRLKELEQENSRLKKLASHVRTAILNHSTEK
jgi:putative transposase